MKTLKQQLLDNRQVIAEIIEKRVDQLQAIIEEIENAYNVAVITGDFSVMHMLRNKQNRWAHELDQYNSKLNKLLDLAEAA